MRRFHCSSVPEPGAQVELSADVSHHVLQVTRVPRGSQLVVYDGTGRSAVARLVDVRGGHAVVVVEALEDAREALAPLHAILAVTKGARFETALRMAVELGATELWPVLAKRSVAKGDRRARWLRVIDGAVSQSHRAASPVLHPLQPLPTVLALPAWNAIPTRWVCVPGAVAGPGSAGAAAVLIGPEGGWTDPEVAACVAAGWTPAGLGSTVLRAETAVAAALTRVRCAGPAE